MVAARRDLGQAGEQAAARFLLSAGMAILHRNRRVPSGEIDLIARDGDDIVFVEVRTRRAEPGTAAESIDTRKLHRMWRCALEYCDLQGIDPGRARLDVVAIDLPARAGEPRSIAHFSGLEIPG